MPWVFYMLSSVQMLSRVQFFATPGTAARQASLSITNAQSLLKFMSHWVGDAIQPSHPLSSPSPPVLSPSQHQGLFKWVSSSHQVAKVFEFQLQHQSFQWTLRTDFFRIDWFDVFAVQGTLKTLSNTTVQKYQFLSAQLSSQSNSHVHTWPQEKP